MPIEIRTGPQGSSDEGAFEDGVQLTVIGSKLQVGEKMPDCVVYGSYSWSFNAPSGPNRIRTANILSPYILYTVNGFATPVCAEEARECQILVARRKIPKVCTLYGLSNEGPDFLLEYYRAQGITYHLLSTENSDAGIKLGTFIPEYDGALQRALFGVVEGKITYAEYVYDQGGPLPDFDAVIQSVKESLPKRSRR